MAGQRIFGLSGSGMDVDSMVKQLMQAKRAQFNKLYQNRTLLEWKKSDYTDTNKNINDFRNTLVGYKMSGALSIRTVSSTKAEVATATANAEANNISHTLSVEQLATGVQLGSVGNITNGASKDTIAKQFYGGNAPTEPITLSIANGTASAKLTIDPNKSIYDVVNQINSAKINVTANYDATLDRFFINTANTGANSGIDFSGSDINGLDFITNKLAISSEPKNGVDAKFSLDGVGMTEESNSFTISGVSYNLSALGETKLNVATDVDKTVASIKGFVDAYNKMLDSVNDKLAEPRYRDYMPLTDDQKKDMKETEITAWEKKAKSGMLAKDPTLQNFVYGMRSALSTPVDGVSGTYNSAASLGITSGAYTEEGHVYLDDSKLRAAITADPDAVLKVFGSNGGAKNGIAFKLDSVVDTVRKQITTVAGRSAANDNTSSIGRQINSYTSDIKENELNLKTAENRYYQEFSAMEKAINKMNSQSSWISQQMSGK
ncbi:MAG: flagellar capping protein [Firmicutes bacterium]|nr:flagellar capping protein [Bacillota bacterium]